MSAEPIEHYLARMRLTADPWHRRELGAARERVSRKGEAAGPGKTAGTCALALNTCPRIDAPHWRSGV